MGRPYPHQKEKRIGHDTGGGVWDFLLVLGTQKRCGLWKEVLSPLKLKTTTTNGWYI